MGERLLLQGLSQNHGVSGCILGGGGHAHTEKPLRTLGGVAFHWLRCSAEVGTGPPRTTSTVSSLEWAAALCCEAAEPLPANVYDFDFEEDEDDTRGGGLLSERFAVLLQGESGGMTNGLVQPASARFAHWLHECVVESKLGAFPIYLLLFQQTQHVVDDCTKLPARHRGPASPTCSVVALDQLLTVEQFYKSVQANIGTDKEPMISGDFLTTRCAAVRNALNGENVTALLVPALQAYCRWGGSAHTSNTVAPSPGVASHSDWPRVSPVLALFSRVHGLPNVCSQQLREVAEALAGGRGGSRAAEDTASLTLRALPRLRRALPGASAEGLRRLAAAWLLTNDASGIAILNTLK